MTQIAIPDGFDLIYFSWDRMPLPAAVKAFANVGFAASSAAFGAAVPRAIERTPVEEDVERWDGLS